MFSFLLTKQTTSTKCQKTITRNFYVVMLLTKLQISDTVEQIVRTAAFVTLKDHKENFCYNSTRRLMNPSKKWVLGKVSKQLVEKRNSDIIDKLQLNQWYNNDAILKCFNNITGKSDCSFIQFDMLITLKKIIR